MSKQEIVSLIITLIALLSFCVTFTILFSSYCKSSIEQVISGKKDIELLDSTYLEKKKKTSKASKIIKKVFSYFILGLLFVIFLFSLFSKISNNITPFNNYGVVSIASGSMSYKNEANTYLYENNLNNQFQTYDLIVLHKVKEDNLKLYDIVAYRNSKNKIIIHRIIDIKEDSNGKYYIMRGDSNNISDVDMPYFKDIVGKYENKKVPVIGMFSLFLKSYSGLATIVMVIYCIGMFDYNYNKLKKVCYNRIDILTKIISKPSDLKEVKTSYVQYIYYHGNVYEFVDNQFVKKIEGKKDDDTLYLLSKENDKIDIQAKDVNENKDKTLNLKEKQDALKEIKERLGE